MQKKYSVKNRKIICIVVLACIYPIMLAVHSAYDNRSYGVLSIIFILLAIFPFLMKYEMKKPKAREWVPIAVMASIAAIGRVIFAPIPSFKPTSAIIIITASVFGAEAGFLTGIISALASNLFFGQGPWTPWQMFAWGAVGFISGSLLKGQNKTKEQACILGGVSGFLFGWIMNIFTAISYIYDVTVQSFLGLYISSFIFDLVHSIATIIFLYFLWKPWRSKLQRVKVKF
ncbi:MAG: ECF transporter S component [Clostridium sp.]|uniref:ECF transporter S component n=1 Tax=Clostridium sp. TaxID=1506 RepID=UPI003F3A4953